MISVMRTATNITIQLAALAVFAALRLAVPGWMLLIFIFSLVGPVLVLVPSAMAIGVVRRGRLDRAVAAPFLAAAITLVIAGALFPDLDDQRGYIPIISGLPPTPADDALGFVGHLAGLAFIGAVVWIIVAVVVTRRRRTAGGPEGRRPSR